MSELLLIAETRAGGPRDVDYELVTAATGLKEQMGGKLTVCVVDSRPEAAAEALKVGGVDEVLAVTLEGEGHDAHRLETALIEVIEAEQPRVIVVGHTIEAMSYAPAVAVRGNLGFASDVTDLEWRGELIARRGAYGDKLVAELEFPGKAATLLTVRVGAFDQTTDRGDAPIRMREARTDASPIEHLGYRETEGAGDVDITKADFLFAVGRGVEDKENLPALEKLAERMGATLSVSRPLVDAGWVPNARQVGQSGKTVAPKLYLALGISGAVQHLAGMRKAGTIIAVNTDPEAPIFSVADYGVVADLFDVADELERLYE